MKFCLKKLEEILGKLTIDKGDLDSVPKSVSITQKKAFLPA